ncbi:MAG: Uma2 family endonuclease [Saprospiraceae bacterium]|nr:Uma2 family endonuclease [Saprospiraceae bacterium]
MVITSLSQLDPNGTYTYADYLLWKFEERIEILKGKIAQMAAPNRIHQNISGNLFLMFGNALWKSPSKVYAAPFDVRLTRMNLKGNKEVTTVVQPDICVICEPSKLDVRGCVGAPDLIIEILSPGNGKKEMKDKFEIYQENGVKEYWIVMPDFQAVQVFILNDKGKYIGQPPVVSGDTLKTNIVPDLVINISDVFAE